MDCGSGVAVARHHTTSTPSGVRALQLTPLPGPPRVGRILAVPAGPDFHQRAGQGRDRLGGARRGNREGVGDQDGPTQHAERSPPGRNT